MLLKLCQNIQYNPEYSDRFFLKSSSFVTNIKKSIPISLYATQSLSTAIAWGISSQGLLQSFKHIQTVRHEDMLS